MPAALVIVRASSCSSSSVHDAARRVQRDHVVAAAGRRPDGEGLGEIGKAGAVLVAQIFVEMITAMMHAMITRMAICSSVNLRPPEGAEGNDTLPSAPSEGWRLGPMSGTTGPPQVGQW
ncbi:MAG TPA: hypothetical protein VI318_16445 [Baekduia sp.]